MFGTHRFVCWANYRCKCLAVRQVHAHYSSTLHSSCCQVHRENGCTGKNACQLVGHDESKPVLHACPTHTCRPMSIKMCRTFSEIEFHVTWRQPHLQDKHVLQQVRMPNAPRSMSRCWRRESQLEKSTTCVLPSVLCKQAVLNGSLVHCHS